MAPTNRGVAKQVQNQRTTAATPVYGHDGTSIVYTQQAQSNSSRNSFPSLNIPFPNVPPGVTRHDSSIDNTPFTHFTQQQQQQQQPFNGMNMGMNPMSFNQQQQQQQFQDHLSASSSAPTPTPTPGPASLNGNGFQGGYYGFGNNNNQMRMAPSSNNFYPGGAGAHPGSPMFANGMQSIQEPFASQSMQQQSQYGMPPMNYNMGFPFSGQQQNSQPFNMQGNMYNMMPFNSSASSDLSSYEPPSTASSDTPPDRDFSVNGDSGMDVEFDMDDDVIRVHALLSPTTEMLTSPSSDRTSGLENGSMDPVVKGEDFGSSALSPPVLGEANSLSGTPTLSSLSKTSSTPVAGSTGKPSLPSSKEKEQNKQKLYRNRKSEFTNKMRDELLGMGMLPSTRVTHAPEIMSKTADTLRDYRELLEMIQNKIEGMPSNIAAVPGAVKKLLNENGNVFNNLRQAPQLSLAQQQQQQSQQSQQQTGNHGFKPDIKVPLGTNMTGTPNPGRITRSNAHVF